MACDKGLWDLTMSSIEWPPLEVLFAGKGASFRARRRRRADLSQLRTAEFGQTRTCFVAMPFSKDFDDVFRYGIQPVVSGCGFRCIRLDYARFVGDIPEHIHSMVDQAAVVVADMTGANANVYYEVGYAQHADKPIILVCNRRSALESNVRNMRCLFYEHIHDLEDQLRTELGNLSATVSL